MSNKVDPVTKQPTPTDPPPMYSEVSGGNYAQPPTYTVPGQAYGPGYVPGQPNGPGYMPGAMGVMPPGADMSQMAAQANQLFNNMFAQMNGEPQAEVKWAEPVPPVSGVLPGLQYLVGMKKIVLDEHKDYMNAMSMLGHFNKYRVISDKGEQLYLAEEDKSDRMHNSVMGRPGLAPIYRAFNVRVKDPQGTELMTVSRGSQQGAYSSMASCFACLSCCAATADVSAGGAHLGSIIQKWSCSTRFAICDAEGVEKVEVTMQGGCCGPPLNFSLKNKDNGHFGDIRRKFNGGLNVLGIKDTFEINFPSDMNPKTKALIIAAAILFDFLYFHHRSVGHGHHHGRR